MQGGAYAGDGGIADRELLANHFVSMFIVEEFGNLKPLSKGGQFLHGEQITEKVVAFIQVLQRGLEGINMKQPPQHGNALKRL